METAIALAGSRADLFREATNHSRRVQFLKCTLPLVAVVLAVSFGGYSYLSAPPTLEVRAEGATFLKDKFVMVKPQLNGFIRDNLPYSITANRAVHDPNNQSVVEFFGIDADLPISTNSVVKIDAVRGVYNRDSNTLDLTSDVIVRGGDEMIAWLKSAYLDLGSGAMKTDQPVKISLNDSTVRSDSMSMHENGQIFVFENKVHVDIDPKRTKTAPDSSGGGGAGN